MNRHLKKKHGPWIASISWNSSWISACSKSQFFSRNCKNFTTSPKFQTLKEDFLQQITGKSPNGKHIQKTWSPRPDPGRPNLHEWCKGIFFEAAQWRVSKKKTSLWWRLSAKCIKMQIGTGSLWHGSFNWELSPSEFFEIGEILSLVMNYSRFYQLNMLHIPSTFCLRFHLLPYNAP